MPDNDHAMTRGELLALVGIIVAIAVAGALLYLTGYNEAFYSHTAWVRGVFEVITDLGDEKVYFIAFVIAFLSYDMRFGKRLAWVFFSTLFVGDLLKQFVQDPRPPANQLRPEPVAGWGFPSGHSTSSVSMYGYIMLSHRDAGRPARPLAAVCMFAMVAVPVSRMVIGAHDLQDVVGGVVISLAILTAYMLIRPRVADAMGALSLVRRIALQVVAVLLLWGLGVLVLVLRRPDELGPSMEALGQAAGLLLGCAIAFPLEEAYVGYRPDLMDARRRVGVAVVGTLLMVGVYAAGLGTGGSHLPAWASDLVAYLALMLLLALVAPCLLTRLWPDASLSRARPPTAGRAHGGTENRPLP